MSDWDERYQPFLDAIVEKMKEEASARGIEIEVLSAEARDAGTWHDRQIIDVIITFVE
jgi:hypothetical protein